MQTHPIATQSVSKRCQFLREILPHGRPASPCAAPPQVLCFTICLRISLDLDTDRPRSVLRFGLVMAQASTDPHGLYYGIRQTFHQPTNQPTRRVKGTKRYDFCMCERRIQRIKVISAFKQILTVAGNHHRNSNVVVIWRAATTGVRGQAAEPGEIRPCARSHVCIPPLPSTLHPLEWIFRGVAARGLQVSLGRRGFEMAATHHESRRIWQNRAHVREPHRMRILFHDLVPLRQQVSSRKRCCDSQLLSSQGEQLQDVAIHHEHH